MSEHNGNGQGGPPSEPVSDGRGPGGRFGANNKFSKGNPHARRINRIRAELFRAVDPKRIRKAADKLMELAELGDLKAFAELLDRTVGRSIPSDVEERLARLEALLAERNAEVRR